MAAYREIKHIWIRLETQEKYGVDGQDKTPNTTRK